MTENERLITLNKPDENGNTVLHLLAKNKDIEGLKSILLLLPIDKRAAAMNAKDLTGNIPLQLLGKEITHLKILLELLPINERAGLIKSLNNKKDSIIWSYLNNKELKMLLELVPADELLGILSVGTRRGYPAMFGVSNTNQLQMILDLVPEYHRLALLSMEFDGSIYLHDNYTDKDFLLVALRSLSVNERLAVMQTPNSNGDSLLNLISDDADLLKDVEALLPPEALKNYLLANNHSNKTPAIPITNLNDKKNKFFELSSQEIQHFPSYKKINGEPVSQPTMIYNIRELQTINENELETHLFEEDDFVIPPAVQGRSVVKAKIGRLYLEFQPGGKGSFILNIKLIDTPNRQLRSFLNLRQPRYNDLEFENLLPIGLDAFYSSRSFSKPSMSAERLRQYKENLCPAFEVKQILTKLLFNQNLTDEEKQLFHENYGRIYLGDQSVPAEQAPVKTQEPIKDIQHFGLHPKDKPTTLFEVAAKIGATALLSLSLSQNEIAEILNEYAEINVLKPAFFNNTNVKKEILDVFLDKNRFQLKSIIDDIDVLLQNAIEQLIVAQQAKTAAHPNVVSQFGFFTSSAPVSQAAESKNTQPLP